MSAKNALEVKADKGCNYESKRNDKKAYKYHREKKAG